MWEGMDDETRKRLQLDSIEHPNIEPLHRNEDRAIAAEVRDLQKSSTFKIYNKKKIQHTLSLVDPK